MFLTRLHQLEEVVEKTSYVAEEKLGSDEAGKWICDALRMTQKRGGTCYIVGNGGSAGIASHIANDFLKTLGLRSLTLTDSNLLTCIGNDLGYENVYSMPLNVLMKSEDMLIAISSSGQSLNIIKAAQIAKDKGAKVITLSGFLESNPLRSLGDLNIWLDSDQYGLVEVGHFFILHTIVDQYKSFVIEKLRELQCTLK
ncbi:MAG: SIS domain-containing protein [Simkaniaceae bacterium]|nr:SIS domain-containing protein [Simkaniaceae bacterium]